MSVSKSNIEISFFKESDLNELDSCIIATVKQSYQNLYPLEAIDFFLLYLNKKDIIRESKDHYIIILREDGVIAGTATLIEQHVKRVFVSPDCQGKGYGKLLMKELEDIALHSGHTFIELHSSMFAKRFYDELGYLTFKMGNIPVKNNQVLTYYRMAKYIGEEKAQINFGINGDSFVLSASSMPGSSFAIGTSFIFYQQENLIFIEYFNRSIKQGEMFGALEESHKRLYYSHIDKKTRAKEQGILTFEMMDKKIRLSLSEINNGPQFHCILLSRSSIN